jgi:glycosyltransferase involved in cell wall biosynthesis
MKPLFVISCPIDTYSGYGARSRDLVKSIIELDKYDVKILSQRWGNTPWDYIEDHKEEWGFLSNHILNQPQLPKQPEIWAQITIPSEFQPIGKYNIGFTAGIETTTCAADWIDGLNRMDVNFVSSNHAKKVFETSQFEEKNNQGQTIRQIKLQKPIEVLFEGADIEKYKPLETNEIKNINLSEVKEDFAYLFVGHWLQGDLGEDRKNVGLLVKAFYETFKNKTNKPALILKTSQIGSSYMDREEILKRIKQIRKTVNSNNLPNIYLLHGEFTDEEMNEIYNHSKVKAMISLTKGEGFGRPLLEFTLTKKPLITTAWSGHMDFLKMEFNNLIGGQLANVHSSAANQWLLPESQWFSPDHSQIGHYLKDVFENYKNYTDKAKRQAYHSKTNFSWDKMKEKIDNILSTNIPEFPNQIQLKLPQLKKVGLPKLTPLQNG